MEFENKVLKQFMLAFIKIASFLFLFDNCDIWVTPSVKINWKGENRNGLLRAVNQDFEIIGACAMLSGRVIYSWDLTFIFKFCNVLLGSAHLIIGFWLWVCQLLCHQEKTGQGEVCKMWKDRDFLSTMFKKNLYNFFYLIARFFFSSLDWNYV